ncbi:hypothetical protein CPAR01_16765 [Colletotrichum paranaense]|uniref:Uncharacterized protein n=1 Tax=Colletotrichum paranaense TaxID=1914294 RepID=A0ABQ9RV67_9PEZI|nr:uncharacterized protein CPAR01_16765 [Colletotrichum paranaense]KAK1515383.1 hypothetical protein CPAR01_16765 [Colletotrichum paranaense]
MIVPRIETQFRVSPRAPHLQLALSRRVIAPMLLSLLPGSQKKQEAREIPRDRHTQGDPAAVTTRSNPGRCQRAPTTVDTSLHCDGRMDGWRCISHGGFRESRNLAAKTEPNGEPQTNLAVLRKRSGKFASKKTPRSEGGAARIASATLVDWFAGPVEYALSKFPKRKPMVGANLVLATSLEVRKCVWCWAEEPHRSVAASQMLLPPPYVVAGHDFSTFQNLRGDEAASQSPHSCVPEPQGSSDEIRPSPSQQANEKTYLVPPATSSTPFGALTLISGLPLGILVTAPPSHLHLVPPGPSPEDGHHFLSLKSESAFLLLLAVSVTSVNS